MQNTRTLVIPINLIAIEVLYLRAMTRVCLPIQHTSTITTNPRSRRKTRTVEEKRIILLRVLDKPAHRVQDILARRVLTRIGHVVAQDDNIFLSVPMICKDDEQNATNGEARGEKRRTGEETLYGDGVVDAALELLARAEVVDADLQHGM